MLYGATISYSNVFMKILFISYTYWPPDFGGALIRIVQTLESLAERGHQVTVLTRGIAPNSTLENSFSINILRSSFVGNNRLARVLRRIVYSVWVLYYLFTKDYDIIHLSSLPGINRSSSWFIGYIFSSVAHIRKVQSIFSYTLVDTYNAPILIKGLEGFIKLKYLRRLDVIVSISPLIHEAITSLKGTNSVLILNGVRDSLFTPLNNTERKNNRSALGINEQTVVFAFLGSVDHRKGFDLLSEAFSELSNKYNNWYLWVIGPYSHKENQNLSKNAVNTLYSQLKENPRVRFFGRINDRQYLATILASSDVFVFPSRREGFGNAPVEAMSAGIPVIIARLPGITDLANIHDVTGLYIDPGNVEQLKKAMRRLGEDAELRQRMGKAARQRVEEAFSWDEYVSRWEKLYELGEIE